jgi:NADH-quinone oxidoreductase subunit G
VAARLSAGTAAETGCTDTVRISTDRGSITVALEITEMPDRVVWLPLNSAGSAVHTTLGAGVGDIVRIEPL